MARSAPGPRDCAAMIRRISTKLLLAVLAAVVLPFLGFAVFVDSQMAERLSRDVVLYLLKGLAADLAGQVDREIEEVRSDVQLWAGLEFNYWAVKEQDEQRQSPELVPATTFRDLLGDQLDRLIGVKGAFDLLLLVDPDGRRVSSNRMDRLGRELPGATLEELSTRDFSGQPWFERAFLGEPSGVDWQRSDLLPAAHLGASTRPEDYHIGFAHPVYSDEVPEQVIGVLYALVNWSVIQDEVKAPVLKSYFQGLVGPQGYPSAYAWIWGSDCDTILAHDDPSLYGESVSDSPRIGLPQMVAAARSADWDLYPEYTFRGRRKNAAFKHTAGPEQGGFGWVVGVGIDNDDIFKAVHELRALLFKATLVVLLVSVLLTLVIARRTTSPILALREHTQRVAAGDLGARLEIKSGDELGELAQAFNAMTAEIAASRERMVKAEKDAAWREMARQVAHDIKNPLTPIQLSIDLLERAKGDESPKFDAIFDRTVDTVRRQVAHLRDIASDFHALTGVGEKRLERVDLGALADEVLELDRAWSETRGIRAARTGEGGQVRADPGLLRRVLQNLVSNAIEAMPHGGELTLDVRRQGTRVAVDVRDSGAGLPEEVRARLFEPYFTTRTSGTGLGLAIAKRVIEEAGGTIELSPRQPGPGTVARFELPSADGEAA